MDFEFDREKSAVNKDKHGIDFEEAQELWRDSDLLEIPARTSD
ncbi:MAG: BrnT family toxin, partial [Bryobacteraceae bacterium]